MQHLSRRQFAKAAFWLPTLALAGPAWAQTGDDPVEFVESQYNNIYIYKRGTQVSMTFGHNKRLYTESVMDTTDTKALPVEYTKFMTAAVAYTKKQDSILQIGLGGGRTSWYLHVHLPDAAIDVAEIDPVVIDLAKKYFAVKEEKNFAPVAMDGRLFLLRNPAKRYDLICIDAYRGPFVPFHLLTKEFYVKVAEHLTEGGIVAQNVEPSTMVFNAAVATMKSVFRQVDFFPAAGNVVLVAYNDAERLSDAELLKRAEALQAKYAFRYPLTDLVKGRREPSNPVKGQVLTDDFAPVETLHAIERKNEKWK
ncbi:spermidine synthase [Prosthecomicrobium hirschii]|uniref:spermidine synthase n=1 Tax=Prosthecodimorpha hirschii TaxID=665126 RepID=UPI0011290A74|nr:fused MFS/spermidine synthase [Prosthecomicrobium hirschii]MCW1841039.1 fused MFS/spermidine synthase [Prosthecomicrobium hirschii]TPQ48961.1 spermidine synthase [Prosthecomicrobium hirschii]